MLCSSFLLYNAGFALFSGLSPWNVLRNDRMFITNSATANVPVGIRQAVVQIRVRQPTVGTIVEVAKRLPQRTLAGGRSTSRLTILYFVGDKSPLYANA